MKATLHFELPEDDSQLQDCLDGAEWHSLVRDILDQYLRPRWKHDTQGEDVAEWAAKCRDWILQEIEYAGLELD